MPCSVLPQRVKALQGHVATVPVEDDDRDLGGLVVVPRRGDRSRGRLRGRCAKNGRWHQHSDTTWTVTKGQPQGLAGRGSRSALPADDLRDGRHSVPPCSGVTLDRTAQAHRVGDQAEDAAGTPFTDRTRREDDGCVGQGSSGSAGLLSQLRHGLELLRMAMSKDIGGHGGSFGLPSSQVVISCGHQFASVVGSHRCAPAALVAWFSSRPKVR